MLRKRASRIRGVAGTLDALNVLVVDAAVASGPGIVRVAAEAGAQVAAASDSAAALDVQLAKLQTPTPVSPIAHSPTEPTALVPSLSRPVDCLVLVPSLEDEVAILGAITIAADSAAQMKDRGHAGNITFVTSAIRSGQAGAAAARLRVAMSDLAARVATNGIRVNEVAPGPVGANRRDNPISHKATPLGHVTVHPVEVGKAVWFLMNDSVSSGVTGATLRVDRGASLSEPTW